MTVRVHAANQSSLLNYFCQIKLPYKKISHALLFVVECVITHRKPPEVRIWKLRKQSCGDFAAFDFHTTSAAALAWTD